MMVRARIRLPRKQLIDNHHAVDFHTHWSVPCCPLQDSILRVERSRVGREFTIPAGLWKRFAFVPEQA